MVTVFSGERAKGTEHRATTYAEASAGNWHRAQGTGQKKRLQIGKCADCRLESVQRRELNADRKVQNVDWKLICENL